MIENTSGEVYFDDPVQLEEESLVELSKEVSVRKRKKSRRKPFNRTYHIYSKDSSVYDQDTLAALAKLEFVEMEPNEAIAIDLSAKDVLDMTDSHKTLFIRGNAKHRIYLRAARQKPSLLIDQVVYHQFAMEESTVFIESSINITVSHR